MCRDTPSSEPPALPEISLTAARHDGFSPLVDETKGEEKGEEAASGSTPPPAGATAVETSPAAEIAGGTLTALLVLVLNVTYAGVVMGGTAEFLPFLSHGISMCLACTSISTSWMLIFRRNMPFITCADSFMAVLFASTAANIVRRSGDNTSKLGTLAAAMLICSLTLAAGYVAVGVTRVCNVIHFVPSPVMAGYQASIGYLLLESASTLASGCSLLHPACFVENSTAVYQLLAAVWLGVGLHVAQRYTEGVTRTVLMPSLLLTVSTAFQLIQYVFPHLADYQSWSLEIPTEHSSSLAYDLDFWHIDWSLAFNEATLTAVTAFVPNLLGKLLQCVAMHSPCTPFSAPAPPVAPAPPAPPAPPVPVAVPERPRRALPLLSGHAGPLVCASAETDASAACAQVLGARVLLRHRRRLQHRDTPCRLVAAGRGARADDPDRDVPRNDRRTRHGRALVCAAGDGRRHLGAARLLGQLHCHARAQGDVRRVADHVGAQPAVRQPQDVVP